MYCCLSFNLMQTHSDAQVSLNSTSVFMDVKFSIYSKLPSECERLVLWLKQKGIVLCVQNVNFFPFQCQSNHMKSSNICLANALPLESCPLLVFYCWLYDRSSDKKCNIAAISRQKLYKSCFPTVIEFKIIYLVLWGGWFIFHPTLAPLLQANHHKLIITL